jgi:hypothetical protein
VERHEERPEHLAEDDGRQAPEQVQAQADADEANHQRRQLGIAQEPQRELVTNVAMPLSLRDVVDGVDFQGGLGRIGRALRIGHK